MLGRGAWAESAALYPEQPARQWVVGVPYLVGGELLNYAATGVIACKLRCAVKRRVLSVGEIPTRQLSLQPVAIGAAVEVTKQSEPLV